MQSSTCGLSQRSSSEHPSLEEAGSWLTSARTSLGFLTLKGFGSGVVEVLARHDGDTFRAVYTVCFEGAVYVLHAYQK